MKLSIIDYGAGNLFSVASACRRLGYTPELTGDPEVIMKSDKVIFPGVGNAVSASVELNSKGLDEVIRNLEIPVLGICLGMQMMFDRTEEGNTSCLGIFNGNVKNFSTRIMDKNHKIPHMGWNRIYNLKGVLFRNIPEGSYFYFVHSFFVPDVEYVSAICNYGGYFTAAVEKDNFYGCQFHPEKSGRQGLEILKNFIEL